MADLSPTLFKGITVTLICTDTNEGGAGINNPDEHAVGREVVDANMHGFSVKYRNGDLGEKDIMISFVGVKFNDVIGTLKRGYLEVLPHIGVTINSIEATSHIPDSYRKIPMTGLYIDTSKVDIQCSQLVKFDGIIHTRVTSVFKGSKVETIRDGVCRLCLQKTNHPREECPSGDVCMEPNRNCGPCTRIPIECKPVCKENAIGNGLRFDGVPKSADEDELRDKFGEYGEVKKLVLLRDSQTGLSKRRGAVCFVNIDNAERALNALKDQYQMELFV